MISTNYLRFNLYNTFKENINHVFGICLIVIKKGEKIRLLLFCTREREGVVIKEEMSNEKGLKSGSDFFGSIRLSGSFKKQVSALL